MFKKNKVGLRNPANHKKKLINYLKTKTARQYAFSGSWCEILGIISTVGIVVYLHFYIQKPNGQEISYLKYAAAYLAVVLAVLKFTNKFIEKILHYKKVEVIRTKKIT